MVVRIHPVSERETRVTLHHTGWGDGGEWDQAYAYFDRAWGNVLGNLKKRFETGADRLDRVARADAQDHAEELTGISVRRRG